MKNEFSQFKIIIHILCLFQSRDFSTTKFIFLFNVTLIYCGIKFDSKKLNYFLLVVDNVGLYNKAKRMIVIAIAIRTTNNIIKYGLRRRNR